MAKIKEQDDLDDLNFDDLGDFDDFGGFDDMEPNAGKRNVFSRLAGGFKDGVKASFTDPKNHRTVIKEALPKGYSRIYDTTEFALESTSDLINTASKGWGDNRDQMKKAMREVLPSFGENAASSKIGQRLKSWSEDVRNPHVMEDVDQEQAFMKTEVGDVFGEANGSAFEQSGSSEDKVKKQGKVSEAAQRKLMQHASQTSQILSDRIGVQLTNDMVRHLGGMHAELQRLTAYQDQVTNAYQRKSLEIKYRHYFVSRKSLDVLQQNLELSRASYDKIITNTSLPEAVKIQTSEHAHMIMREKFLGEAIAPATQSLGAIGRKIVQKSKLRIQEFFKDLGAGLGNITDGASSVLGEDSGIDPWELGGDIIGQQIGGMGMKKGASKAAKFLARNKKLARLGAAGAGLANNGGRIFQSLLKNDTGIKAFEWLKGTGFLDEFAYRRDETIRKDASSMLDDQAMWDQKSRKALTEVIPGLLEKANFYTGSILAFMRGEPAPEMERYNYASGLFESDKKIRERIKKDVLGEAGNKDTAQALRNFVGEFEQKRKLSKEAKTALMNTALSESLNGGMFNMEAYARGDKRWNPDEKINEEIQAAFMEAFYPDYKEGVDDNKEGGILGDVNRTWRRGQAIGARGKAMDAFQGISTHQGNLSKQSILNHFNVAGGNALLEMGLVTQDGNTLKMNREKLDSTIIQQALGLDVGYITSTLFELEENENSLGHSVNSHVRKMIVELDKAYSSKIEATEANFLRETFKAVQTMFFHGTNERLLNLTDLDVSEKKKGLESVAKKLSEFMSTKEFEKLSDDAQEYFKQRLDIIKTGSTAARVSAPLRDFLSPPLTIDENAWMKSKRKVLDGLKDAGLDEDILKELEKSIKNVKDATGRTVDTKLMELTGTRTYGEAAAFINRMSDKGLNWLTKSLKDPNTPPDPVLDGNSMFTKLGQTTEHLAKHSAIGRWMYTQFIKADSAINNSYENIENNQGLQREVNRLGGNRDGNEFFYDDLPQNKFRNLKAIDNPLAGHGGVLSRNPVRRRQPPSLEQVETEAKDSIINIAAMSIVDILTMGFDKFVRHLNTQNGTQTQSWSNQGTLFNPANAPAPKAAKITGIDTDIEIHHTGGIVGEGRKWGGAGDLFGNAPRYHSGGMVKGTLDIKRDPNDLGVLIATLPNGEQVTIRSKTLTRMGARASKRHIKEAFRLAEKEVRARYSQHFKEDTVSETLNPSVSTSPLKVDEVPAVLQKGEEVLTADDPRHRNNIREVLEGPQTPMSSAADDYLEGILENTTVANQLLQAIVEKEFKGGSESLGKITDKIKSGWTKAKTRTGKMVKGVQSRITGLFTGTGQSGLLGKARSWVMDKASAGLTAASSSFGMFKGAALDAGSWLKDKATSGLESAQEIGEKLKAKIPSLDEIKKFGGVTVDATWVPAKEFVSGKYQATKDWWAKHHPSFKMDFSEFWTGFKEKFKNWNPTKWFKKGEGPGLGGRISAAWGSVKEMGSNILSGPANLKKWVGGKVRSGLNMLKGFMSGGAWAAMKYRNVEEITDPVSGLRQVYMGLVDLQSIVMDRMPKKKLSFFDKDGDGKRDQSGRFIGRDKADTAKVDKDGNVIPGSEKKGPGLLGSIFGTSMIGLAIKALIGGIVGETMSNLFGFDLGLVGNTLAGMATVGGGLWAAKKATGWAAGKAVDGAKAGAGALWNKVRGKENLPGTGGIVPNQPGQKGKGGAMAAAAGMLGGQGCGCCCCDDGLGDLGGGREDRRKKGKKPQRGRKAGRSGRGVRVPSGATNLAATGAQGASSVAQGAGRAGGLAGRLGGMGGRLGAVGAVVGGGLALSAISSDAEASAEEKTVATSEVVGGMGGALAGAAAGAAVGSVVPIVGTAIGGLIGGVAGHWMGSKAGGAVGNSLVAPTGADDVKQAQLQSIQQKSQSGEALTPEEKKTLEQAAKEEPNFLVTLLKYSPLGLAWFAAQGLTNLITGTLGIVWDGVKWVASGVGKVIGGAASLIGSAVGGVAGMIWNGAKFVVGTAAKVVGGAAGAIWDGVKWVVGTTGKAVGAVAGAVWNGVSWVGKSVAAGVGAAVGAVGTVASHVGNAVWEGTKAAGSAAATVLTAPVKAVAWTAEKAWSATKAVGRGVAKVGKFLWDHSPVALAVGAVGALLGAGGKLFTYLSREKNPITRFRFAQYGLSFDKRKYSEAVLSLEADLLPTVSVVKGNSPSFEPKRPFEEYLAMFKVDPTDENEKNEWLTWFNLRFKPVFLSHVSEWNKTLRNTNIHEGDEKLGNEPAIELLKNVHYKNGERAPYNHIVNPFGDETGELPGVAEVNKAYAIAVKHAEFLPKKALGDLEKSALGLDDVKRNRAEEAKEEKDAEKITEALQAKGPDELGMWDKVKAGALGLADKLNPMNFFTKQDENQMSGWDRMTNAVTTFGQEAAGTVGSWAGGGKQYASHELSLAKACIAAGMTNPKEVAMFIAQCAHETGGFKWLKELGNDSYFRKYNNRKDLGNGPNDGARFKGRGYIQLTGRSNYTRFAKASGIDVVSNPDLVSNDKNVAAKASLFWWMSNKRARAAGQAGDVVSASKAVNGGTNGLADRQKKWAYYSKAIGNDLNAWVAKLESGDKGVLEKAGDAIGKGASAVKGAVQDAGHAVGAAAVGVRAQTAGAVAGGVTAVNQTSAKIVDGAKSALGAVTGNAAVGSDSTTDGKGKNGTPWMKLAEKQVGVNEDDHEGIVRDYHKVGGSLNAGGKTPWCASFVGWVLEKSGIRSTRSAAANSYDKWGQKMAKTNIPFGAIIRVRFKEGNHVAFCTGDKGGARVSTLGGNQSSKKGGSRRNGGEVTLSSVARSEIVSVSYPEGYKPSGGSLSGNVGGAATLEAGQAGVDAVGADGGGSGSTSGEGTGSTGAFQWKGRTDGKATYSEMDKLAKLQGIDPNAKSSTALSSVEKKAVAASENKKADQTRQGMGNWDKQVAPPVAPSIRPAASAPDSELQKIAGFGFSDSTNGAALRPISVSPTTAAMAKQTNADLTAVKSAELDASIRSTQQAEADRAQAANEKAKAARIANTTNETQSEVVNLMRESLAETKQMHQTLREINRGIQKLVSSGGNALRGEEKPKANAPRRPTPPENVPVTMRVT